MAVEQAEQAIRAGEWLTILAALLGPILAVQAQKLVELGRAKNAVKNRIFQTLMATRGAHLSPEHVQALNMIDVAFYGSRVFGVLRQSRKEKAVVRAWRAYHQNLKTEMEHLTVSQRERVFEDRNDKFMELLAAIAAEQHYDFDVVELRNTSYTPIAHNAIEGENNAIRSGLATILQGQRPLPMYVVNLPSSNSAEAPPASQADVSPPGVTQT